MMAVVTIQRMTARWTIAPCIILVIGIGGSEGGVATVSHLLHLNRPFFPVHIMVHTPLVSETEIIATACRTSKLVCYLLLRQARLLHLHRHFPQQPLCLLLPPQSRMVCPLFSDPDFTCQNHRLQAVPVGLLPPLISAAAEIGPAGCQRQPLLLSGHLKQDSWHRSLHTDSTTPLVLLLADFHLSNKHFYPDPQVLAHHRS